MTKWTAQQLPSMDGRTVVITGAGRGLGLVTARELGRAGARVVIAVRDVDRAAKAIADLPGDFDVRELDVADLDSVRSFADSWKGKLDVLINNAGVMDIPAARTAQGLDVQTATNYFGPFVLTNLLLPHLTDRVVTVASQLHRQGKLNLDDLDWRDRKYSRMGAYEASKLAVVHFSFALQRRMAAPKRSVLAHPGIARTALAAHSASNIVNRLTFLTNDVEHGALPILYAATQDVPGNAYVGPGGLGGLKGYPALGKAAKTDPASAERLWQATAALTGIGGS